MSATTAATLRGGSGLKTTLAACFVFVVCLSLIGLGALRESELRDAELRTSQHDARNLARSLIQHADDSIELADTALIGIAHRLETEGFTAEAVSRLQSFLYLRKATLPRLRGLFVYAADGSWVATSETVNLRGFNNADRDYFQHHRTSNSREPFIGPPVKSRSGGQWIITVSRRVNLPDGSFGGVVLATIDVAYFSGVYAGFDMGPQGSLALLTHSGTLLARYPHVERFVGHDFSGSAALQNPTGAQSGAVRFKSVLDGVQRASAFYRSDRFPLTVLASHAEADVLAGWRQGVIGRMGTIVGLTILLAGMGLLVVRELAQRQKLLRVITAQEADFRLLAESSSDMVSRIAFDGTLTYVSPSSLRILGWSPDVLVGRHALAGLHDDDRAAVEAVVEAMRRGEREEALIAYRTRHRTSGIVWLESSLTVTRDPNTGAIDGVVSISRDVSEHKQLETHLARLATLDGLTGLANRRHLDARLAQEAAAVSDHNRPLAVLLIDVDHFKAFNDTYGHQAGDVCLQQISGVLQNHATRPGDIAARYGGEEFALVLPDTDADGCKAVAERIRCAIEDLNIRHDGNSAAPHATVSIGGCSVGPNETLSAAAILSRADASLYAAKRQGRNRSKIAAPIHPLFVRAQRKAS
jgi:diguanylate cyclase (GGDEF)-like protein/PAS domain S-box-containing protein